MEILASADLRLKIKKQNIRLIYLKGWFSLRKTKFEVFYANDPPPPPTIFRWSFLKSCVHFFKIQIWKGCLFWNTMNRFCSSCSQASKSDEFTLNPELSESHLHCSTSSLQTIEWIRASWACQCRSDCIFIWISRSCWVTCCFCGSVLYYGGQQSEGSMAHRFV